MVLTQPDGQSLYGCDYNIGNESLI